MKTSTKTKGLSNQAKKTIKSMRNLRKRGRAPKPQNPKSVIFWIKLCVEGCNPVCVIGICHLAIAPAKSTPMAWTSHWWMRVGSVVMFTVFIILMCHWIQFEVKVWNEFLNLLNFCVKQFSSNVVHGFFQSFLVSIAWIFSWRAAGICGLSSWFASLASVNWEPEVRVWLMKS